MWFLEPSCPVCGVDILGIRVCVGSDGSEDLIIMCAECHSIWLDPKLKNGPYASKGPEFFCPNSDKTLANPKGYWASKTQIQAADWWQYIAHGNAEDGLNE